ERVADYAVKDGYLSAPLAGDITDFLGPFGGGVPGTRAGGIFCRSCDRLPRAAPGDEGRPVPRHVSGPAVPSGGTSCLPRSGQFLPVGQTVGVPLTDDDGSPAPFVLQLVPDAATAIDCEQPQLPIPDPIAQVLQHRCRVGAGEPVRFGHGRPSLP